MIKSISYDQHEIIRGIITLHGPIIELDPTYGRGNFYKNGVPEPSYKMDLDPKVEGVMKADCRNLPLKNESVNSIIFDPPFLATRGRSLSIPDDSNIIAKNFGVYPNEKELFRFYAHSMIEFGRVLKKKGILIVKCQDKVSSGKQYFSHVWFVNVAENFLNFYTLDLFVLLAKSRLTPNWQLKNQRHARKFHSYFLVFRK